MNNELVDDGASVSYSFLYISFHKSLKLNFGYTKRLLKEFNFSRSSSTDSSFSGDLRPLKSILVAISVL